MENCLVKKMKSAVSNDSYRYLGKLRLFINIPSDFVYNNNRYVDIEGSSTTTKVICKGSGGVRRVGAQDYSSEFSLRTDGVSERLQFSPGKYTVLIENIKGIGNITGTLPDYITARIDEDFGEIKNDAKLINIRFTFLSGKDFTPDFSRFTSALTFLDMRGDTTTYVNAASLTPFINLTTLMFPNSASGSLKSLLDTWAENGKTGTMVLRPGNINDITEEGETPKYEYTITFANGSWTKA